MKKLVVFVLFPLLLACSSEQPKNTKQSSYYKVDLVERQVPVSMIKNIQGFFGHRMELNRENYIKQFPIDEYVDFIVERQHTEWAWPKAEQHGKWIESAYLSAIQSDDDELMKKASSVLKRILDSQEEDGYVGATARSYRSPERPLRGMDAYELYFVIHAFITVYEESGDQNALDAAVKLCDYITRYIGAGKVEFWPSELKYPDNVNKRVGGHSLVAGHGAHYGWEGTMLIDPVVRLYEKTGNNEYLEWGKWITENIDKWSGWNAFSKLDLIADGKLGIHDIQPNVHSHTHHMNFLGFLRLYRLTGDKSLLRKVQGVWDDINRRQMYITGGVSVHESYQRDYIKPLTGNVVETCATMSWMLLSQFLLELTGDVKYADAMERLMLNHVLASQTCDGDGLRYYTAPNGYKPSNYYRTPDCCSASGHRIISMLPTFFYAENGNNFYINQYIASDYKGKDFRFKLETTYPESENIKIVFRLDKPVKKDIHLRIPGWCTNAQVIVNGEKINGTQPGTYCILSKQWTNQDKIELIFPMDIRWVKREHHTDVTRGAHFQLKSVETNRIPYALLRGPIVYSLDLVWNDNIPEKNIDLSNKVLINTDAMIVPAEKPSQELLGPVYQTKAIYNNKEIDVTLLPFTNVGHWYEKGKTKPEKTAPAYAYSIWLYNSL